MIDIPKFQLAFKKVEQEVFAIGNKQKIAIAIETINNLILITPVDTGRAVNNWLYSIGTPRKDSIEKETFDKSGGETRRNAEIVAVRAKSGETIYCVNNLDYVTLLNQGSSSKAPERFIENAVERAVRTVTASKIGS